MGLNRVMLMGKALQGPSLRWIAEDLGVAEFTMSVERAFRMSNGSEKTARVEILVQAFGPMALKVVEASKDEGGRERDSVFVEGRLRVESNKGDDGVHRQGRFMIVAERIEFDGAPPVHLEGPPQGGTRRPTERKPVAAVAAA